MTGKENQLKKENQQLRNEIEYLKKQLDKLTEEIEHRREEISHDAGIEHGGDTVGKEQSVEFVSAQCDDFEAFKKYASKELKRLSSRLNVISDACDRILQSIDGFEMYSYQFNIKVIGLPLLAAKETTEQTANLCLQLFHQMGVKDVSINDIDIAHRVPSRNPSNRPDAVVCKFVRRMVKEKIMASRKTIRNITAQQLGFSSEIDVSHLNIYDHLTPRLQTLLYEAKKFKEANSFKFCWAKNGSVFLRKSENSPIRKFANMEDLNAFTQG